MADTKIRGGQRNPRPVLGVPQMLPLSRKREKETGGFKILRHSPEDSGNLRGNLKSVAHTVDNRTAGPQTIKIKAPFDSAILLLSIYPKELETGPGSDTRTPMFIAAHSYQPDCGNNPHPSMEEWVSKIGYEHTAEPYTALKRKGMLTPYNVDEP